LFDAHSRGLVEKLFLFLESRRKIFFAGPERFATFSVGQCDPARVHPVLA
jgi:hypothetical protein